MVGRTSARTDYLYRCNLCRMMLYKSFGERHKRCQNGWCLSCRAERDLVNKGSKGSRGADWAETAEVIGLGLLPLDSEEGTLPDSGKYEAMPYTAVHPLLSRAVKLQRP